MRRRAHARGCVTVLARLLLDRLDELLHGLGGLTGIDDQDAGGGARDRDRCKSADRIVGHFLQSRIDQEARARDQQRIAVGRRGLHHRGADIAAAAAMVLDIEVLPEAIRQLLRQQTAHDVDHAAGRKREKHAHRPVWITIRTRRTTLGMAGLAQSSTTRAAARRNAVVMQTFLLSAAGKAALGVAWCSGLHSLGGRQCRRGRLCCVLSEMHANQA